MVKVVSNGKEVGVKIFGPNFDLMKEILKEHGFTFDLGPFEGETKVWRKKIYSAKEGILELRKIEVFNIDRNLLESMEPTLETEFLRIPYKESCLRKPPLGDFQVNGIKKHSKQTRLLNAFKMGLGKTYTVISAINHIWDKGLIDKLLVVAPTESIYNFKREILSCATFPVKEEEIYIANAENRDPFQDGVKVAIMTYRTFLMLSDQAYFLLKKKKSKKYRNPPIPLNKWGTERAIVLDESHHIKELTARQTKVLHLHKQFFRFRYLLSGTPYPNGVENLYSQVTFMDDGLIPESYYEWLGKIAYLGNRFSQYAINSYKTDEVDSFLERVKPWILREFTEGNIELPDQYIKKIYVGMNKKHREIYRRFIKYIMTISKEQHGRVIMKEVYKKFPYVTLAIDNPCLLKDKDEFEHYDRELAQLISSWKFEDHSKLEACTSLVEKYVKEEKKKVIIWTGHPLTNKQLTEYYKSYNPISIHGEIEIPKGMSKVQYRDTLLERFKTDPKHHILVASFQMLSSAVNIVEAPRAINFDRSWSFLHWAQLIKRNHRIGSTEEVIVNPLIIEKTIEEKQDRVLEKRENLDQELLNRDSLSKEEWEKLFEGVEID